MKWINKSSEFHESNYRFVQFLLDYLLIEGKEIFFDYQNEFEFFNFDLFEIYFTFLLMFKIIWNKIWQIIFV